MSIVHVCMCTRNVFGTHVGHQTSGIVISNGFELLCGCSETNVDRTKTIMRFSLIIAKMPTIKKLETTTAAIITKDDVDRGRKEHSQTVDI